MNICLLIVPYDSGLRGVRMGSGPEHLLSAGLAERLKRAGHDTETATIELTPGLFPSEISAAFDLNRQLASEVRRATDNGIFPLVLSGNCSTAIGTVAGIRHHDPGVLWFDAHGDFNTPETTVGGFLDGMALATLTGRCWRTLAAGVPGFQPVSEQRVALLGARDLDPREAEVLDGSGIEMIAAGAVSSGIDNLFGPAVTKRANVYLHFDFDVLDPAEGPANSYAADGGLSVAGMRSWIIHVARRWQIRAAALTAYDPGFDLDGRASENAMSLMETLVTAVATSDVAR